MKSTVKEPAGLLFSQVGYDCGTLKKIIVRGPRDFISKKAKVRILDTKGKTAWEGPLKYRGPFWKTHWWEADFSPFDKPGAYSVLLKDKGGIILKDCGLRVGRDIIFDACAVHVAIEAMKRREIFGRVKPGWYDAGQLWQEVGAHSVMLYGLCDMYMLAGKRLSKKEKQEIMQRIKNGCDYMALCNDDAVKRGKGAGAFTHDLAMMKDCFTPNDSYLAALAFAKSAEALKKSGDKEKAADYAARAGRVLGWLYNEAKPMKNPDNHPYNQGFPEGTKYPEEWMTRFLMTALWAEIILNSAGYRKTPAVIGRLSDSILARQIKSTAKENGLWSHFYAYDSPDVSEKAWSHGMPERKDNITVPYGSDMHCSMAHPVFCFIEGVKRMPDNRRAAAWKKTVLDFGENYFKPACLASPFLILPRGVFGKEGLLWFSGLWHGTNTIYGQAAAIAMELYEMTKDSAYLDIAGANLQWICGLNSGLTNEAIEEGCVMFSADLPQGRAMPVSMIHGIGARFAGNWTTIRGSICNGFGTGRQFVYDVPPLKKLDSPSALHDEDWISHSGGFLMGLSRFCGYSKAGSKPQA